ncbi:MAG: hypothetical protein JXR83_16835 [Deltaproteobacteria bacterium]|nr:hypothetical protein [Deltaproteobacteria bacterium]
MALCAACPTGPEPLQLEEGCNPLLAGYDCMLPYPSDFFLVPDQSLPSGFSVQHTRAAGLVDKDGYSADVNDWRPVDGFSRVPPIVAVLGTAMSDQGLVGLFGDFGATLRSDSRTVVLDATAVEYVAHFVDLDPREDDPVRRALVMRPMSQLKERHRYIVALQGVQTTDGQTAPAPEGFRRLRDANVGEDPVLKPLLERYERDIFPQLKQAGVDRKALQLAWDFTTGSEEYAIRDMLRGRELVLAELAINPPQLEEIEVYENEYSNRWRRVVGKLRGPMLMASPAAGARLARDDSGQVKLNGTVSFPFVSIIPASVRDLTGPVAVLEFGHGVFGSQAELETEATGQIVERLGVVSFAIDWWGMSASDMGFVIGAVGDEVNNSAAFTDRVAQGMANWLTLTAAIQGLLRDQPAFQRTSTTQPPTTTPLYDAGPVHFLGISQGHILGGIYTSLNSQIDRAILHAGGAGWTHIMFRSLPFERFLFLMDMSIQIDGEPDQLGHQKLVATMAAHFDRIDPATYARFVLNDELPVGPPGNAGQRRVLLQTGIADTNVPTFTACLHARLIGIPMMLPSPREFWGLSPVTTPIDGSALAIFDTGYDDAFAAEATPPELNPVHNSLRVDPEVLEQMDEFLRTGQVVNPCDGVCHLVLE